MTIAIETFILIFSLFLVFLFSCLILAQYFGSPTVYSSKKAIIDAFKLANLKPGETVIDLGCGNARSLIIAANEFKAKGIGVERSPFCYLDSKLRVFFSGNSKNIEIVFGDFKKAEKYLKKIDVVYLYLLNPVLKEIEDWIFDLISKDTRIVSLAFYFPKHEPQKTIDSFTLGQKTKIRLYQE